MAEILIVAAKVALILVAMFAAGMAGYAIVKGPDDLVSSAFAVSVICGLLGAFLRGD